MRKLSKMTFPQSYWGRFWYWFVGVGLGTFVGLFVATLFTDQDYAGAALYWALNAVTATPIVALMAAKMTRPGQPLWFSNPSQDVQ